MYHFKIQISSVKEKFSHHLHFLYCILLFPFCVCPVMPCHAIHICTLLSMHLMQQKYCRLCIKILFAHITHWWKENMLFVFAKILVLITLFFFNRTQFQITKFDVNENFPHTDFFPANFQCWGLIENCCYFAWSMAIFSRQNWTLSAYK